MRPVETKALSRLKRKLQVEILWLYIASVLAESDSYAYEIARRIREKYGFDPGKVLPYVVLAKMEKEGLVQPQTRERRKYYTLTEKGWDAYCQARSLLASLLESLARGRCGL